MEEKSGYLNIPILVGYKVLESGKWSLVPAVGIHSSYLLYYFSRTTFADGEEMEITSTKNEGKMRFIYLLEAGVHYQVSDKVQLGISPYLRTVAPFKNYSGPDCVGIGVDLRYCL